MTEAIPRYGSYYEEGPVPILISGLQCTGSEFQLLNCPFDTSYAVTRCGSYNEAGVKCHGRL